MSSYLTMKQLSGTRVRSPDEIALMNNIIEKLRQLLTMRGAKERDYPILERTERLLEKYSDEEKQVYTIKDPPNCRKKPESISLRYDLTTQFIMYAPLGKSCTFQVGKVYRREKASTSSMRLREFYQFDYDLKGYPIEYSRLEILDALFSTLDCIGLDRTCYTVYVNDRNSVNTALADIVPQEQLNTVCSSLDKLDKIGKQKVVEELVSKNISDPTKVIDAINNNVCTIDKTLFGYPIQYLPTLVRGLDYYTGIIFEVVLNKQRITIAAGGEYQDSIGFSLGLDRILELCKPIDSQEVIYIITFGDRVREAMERARVLRDGGSPAQVYPITSEKQLRNAIAKINKLSGLFEVVGPSD